MRETMRRLGLLLVLVMLVPLADAQTAPAARPSLTLDPTARDAPPGAYANVTAIFANPLDTPITWTLSFAAPSGMKVSYERWDLTIAPGAREHLNATIFTGDESNVTRAVTFVAQETPESARAAQRATKLELRAEMQLRIGPSAPASTAPIVEIRVEPAIVALPRGGNATARLVVVNHGSAIVAPTFEVKPIPGVETRAIDVPAELPPGARVDIPLVIVHTGDQPVGAFLDGGVGLRPRASHGFKIEIVRPAVAIPPAAPDAASVPAASAPTSPPVTEPATDQRIIVAAALASLGAGWTALWLSRHKWLPLLAALYTRLRPSRMLDHPLRRRIADLVQQEPGITFSEIARRLDIAPGQLTHHARMLEKAGIVFSSPDGQARRFFHVGHERLDPVPPLAERALAAVRARPMRASDLAKELGVSRQSIHYHVKLLLADGRLVARGDGLLEAGAPQPSSAAAGLART